MFDELQRVLRRLDGEHSVSVAVPSDDDGYWDRECPSEECQFVFKINEEDWKNRVRDEEVFCPFCGHTADSGAWWTQDQIRHAKDVALDGIKNQINQAMKRDARRFNRRQSRNSFISMKMKVQNTPRLPMRRYRSEVMQLKIECPECACRYAVVGGAYFCPACGHNSGPQLFVQTMEALERALVAIPTLKAAVDDPDVAANMVGNLIESSLQNSVTAFQRLAETLYEAKRTLNPALREPRRNVFQRLDGGSELWRTATGKAYAAYLTASELTELNKFFQQRHLLAHRQGLVDRDYLSRSGDQMYRVGQRLVIKEAAALRCIALVRKLGDGMRHETS